MNRGMGASSWADRLLGLCLTLLAAALALHWAVNLVRDMWLPLLAIGSVGLVAVGLVMYLRHRNRGW